MPFFHFCHNLQLHCSILRPPGQEKETSQNFHIQHKSNLPPGQEQINFFWKFTFVSISTTMLHTSAIWPGKRNFSKLPHPTQKAICHPSRKKKQLMFWKFTFVSISTAMQHFGHLARKKQHLKTSQKAICYPSTMFWFFRGQYPYSA